MMLSVCLLWVRFLSFRAPISHKKTSGSQWLEEKTTVSEILGTLLIKSAEVGYLTYYVFFTKALVGRFCGMAELLGNFPHNDQALLNYALDFFQMDAKHSLENATFLFQ